ncbi:MAG: cyclic nucleotide-binding domain-containing protein [Planctomycetes bacterium]|nr:cyclic nucleotide-binding domain-containing protein [Planctomycetota bacterium]
MKTFIEKYLKDSAIPAKKELYKANSIIFTEMDAGNGMYLIESGQVNIKKKIPYINKEVTIATLGPNENFGELSLLLGRPRAAEVEALTDCIVWFMDEKTFKEAVAKSQEFSLMIMQGLANKLSRMNEKHKEMLSHLKDFTERLEDFSALLHSFAP